MVSVGEIWNGALPAGTELAAGSAGLGRGVSGVAVLKARTPGLGALHNDDLVLLATRTLQAIDPQLTLAQALQSLAPAVAAVCVQGEVQDDAVGVAEPAGLPVFRLPSSIALTEVEHAVTRFLSEQRVEWYRQKESVLQQMTALAVQGQGLDAIAEQMGRLTGHAVLFSGEHGDVPAMYLPPTLTDDQIAAIRSYVDGDAPIPLAVHVNARSMPSTTPPGYMERLTRLVAPVKGHPGVTVALIGPNHAQDGHAQIVLDAGATAAAIELARESAVRETVHRIQGNVIGQLVRGEGDTETLARHAARLGYDLATPRVAIAVRPVPDEGEGASDALRLMEGRLPRVLARYEVRAPVHADDGVLSILYPLEEVPAPTALRRLAGRICADLQVPRHHLVAGISRVHAGNDSFRLAYSEAVSALHLGQALMPDRAITSFEDLGVYRLLLAIPDRRALEDFYESVVGRLAAYDRARGTELVATLDAYLRGANAVEVAERLSLHRNTLLYRLRRIREITDLDLDDPETRFTLQLAMRVAAVLRAPEAVEG